MRVAREQQLAQPLFEVGEITLGGDHLVGGHLAAGRIRVVEHGAGGVEVTGTGLVGTARLDQRLQLPVSLGRDPEPFGVGRGLGVGEARFEFAELIGHGGQASGQTRIDHGSVRLPVRASSRS